MADTRPIRTPQWPQPEGDVRARKGRGAVSNPRGRFERLTRESGAGLSPGGESTAEPIRTTVTIERARSIITRNRSPDIPFDLSINPYRGCEHGCVYCYARPYHAYVGLSAGLDFETRLFAKPDAARRLREELGRPGYSPSPINIGSITDPYQPIEREHRITRAVLEVLAECQHPATVITKSSLIERDIDLLAPMAQRGLAAALITVTTLDPALCAAWEPRAAAPWRRIETIRRLAEAGIPVTLSLSPIVPFVNEPEIESVIQAAAEAGARHVQYSALRLPDELRQVFVDWLHCHFPDRARRVMARLEDLRGVGKLNDARFHFRMRGQGSWAELIRMRVALSARKAGLQHARLDLRTDLFEAPRPSNAPVTGLGAREAPEDGQMPLF